MVLYVFYATLSPLPYLRPPDAARQAQIDGHRPIGILLRRRSVLPRLFLRHRLLPQFRRGRQFLPAAIARASILTQHDPPPTPPLPPPPAAAAMPPGPPPPPSHPIEFTPPPAAPRRSGGTTSCSDAQMLASYMPLKKPKPMVANTNTVTLNVHPVSSRKGTPVNNPTSCVHMRPRPSLRTQPSA